jgi:hypothetical protein
MKRDRLSFRIYRLRVFSAALATRGLGIGADIGRGNVKYGSNGRLPCSRVFLTIA